MDIHTAAHYMKAGYRVGRSTGTNKNRYVRQMNGALLSGNKTDPEWSSLLMLCDLLANDWEIIFDDIINDATDPVQYKLGLMKKRSLTNETGI